jgi:hypothetical protein
LSLATIKESTRRMNSRDAWEEISTIIDNYIRMARTELYERWKKWPLDLANREIYEVIGALLARQVTLATQLAGAPSIWNGHIAPLILRTMTETYITLAWIFGDSLDRSRKFILYGLGQEKLAIEHRKAQIEAAGDDVDKDSLIKHQEAWLNSQRFAFLTEVNIGSWSGIDTRKMAEEAGCLDLYRFAYTPFSAATHSMWHHVSRYNLVICPNPLHGYHGIPIDPPMEVDVDYFYRAAKYVEKAFKLFDEKTGIKPGVPSAFDKLVRDLDRFLERFSEVNSRDLRAADGSSTEDDAE